MKIVIRNGRIIDPANGMDAVGDVYVVDEQITESFAVTADTREINASGQVVCPGLIDIKTNMGEPGSEHDSTMEVESRAAVKGGITTVCIQPNTQPAIDTAAMANMIHQRTTTTTGIRILPLGALTIGLEGTTLTDMGSLLDAGCIGFSNAHNSVRNTLVMRRAMQYAATFDAVVYIRSHDPWLTGNGCVHEGEMSTRLGLPAIPEAAETVAVARDLALVETTGVRAHFSQLSCGRSVEMISEMKQAGLDVTADVAVHNLHLTEFDTDNFNTLCHVIPPLRSKADRERLRAGLKDGTISVICSDHQPCQMDDKLEPFSQSAPGISGLETLLPLTLSLVDENVVDLPAAIRLLTKNPAEILGIESGTLMPGSPADVCVFNPDSKWKFDSRTLVSRGRNNPFDGWEMRGRVTTTIVNGNIVYENGDA